MGSWNRRNMPCGDENEEEYKDLLVFGYASTIFKNDYQSEHIAEERHMVACLGDAENRVDRYDCRLLLPSIDEVHRKSSPQEECPTEALEEELCEEERYLDLHKEMQKVKEEEKRKQQRNAIGFDYGTGTAANTADSDSEDEPFEVPEGVKFPVGLELPINMKQHHIIEKTASFVVANGTQMEIVIKAKQRNNAEQFGFMDIDHRLNPFYKYLQKLIREKKYVPGAGNERKKTLKKSAPAPSSSLAAIAAAHGSESDDSDSDCELHPSLLSGTSKRAPSPEKPGAIGPKKKPILDEKPPQNDSKPAENNVYAALFKNLTHVTRQANGEPEPEPKSEKNTEIAQDANDPFRDGRLDDPEYREWYEAFYGRPCPWIGPRPMLPPTPDLEPILNRYAELVAQRGAEFEESYAGRADLQLQFMNPISPYFSYYQHKVRFYQWKMFSQDFSFHAPTILGSPAIPSTSTVSSPGPSLLPPPPNIFGINLNTPPEPPTPLNRKQRRRLRESFRADESITEPPGVFDPMSPSMTKSASTPAKLVSLDSTPKPVSFSLKPEEAKEDSFRFDPDIDDLECTSREPEPFCSSPSSSSVLLPPPTPPVLPGSTQTQIERQERAKIFMAKLLEEKKAKKQKEDEERARLEQETIRKAEKISESLSAGRSHRVEEAPTLKTVERTPRTLDEIINNRISSLLSESGFAPVGEPKKEEEERKKSRKRSRSRRRSRTRSRSRSGDRRKSRKSGRRHRSRSSSRDRHRHRRNRSRSRSRERSIHRRSERY